MVIQPGWTKRTTGTEETLEEYAKFISGTRNELLISVPDSFFALYDKEIIIDAIRGVDEKEVAIVVLSNQRTLCKISAGRNFEAAVPIIDHYAVSDRRYGFCTYPDRFLDSQATNDGFFYEPQSLGYPTRPDSVIPEFVPKHVEKFRNTPILHRKV